MILGLVAAIIILKVLHNREFQSMVRQDEQINYNDEGVYLNGEEKNGNDYLTVNCYEYQKNKRIAVEKLFEIGNTVWWNKVKWEIISVFSCDVFVDEKALNSFERRVYQYRARVRYISELDNRNDNSQYNDFRGAYINESEIKNINRHSQEKNMYYYFDQFMQIESEDSDVLIIKDELKELVRELESGDVNNKRISKLINKLKEIIQTAVPFASLASNIISILQKI